jgi:hypothetical protein
VTEQAAEVKELRAELAELRERTDAVLRAAGLMYDAGRSDALQDLLPERPAAKRPRHPRARPAGPPPSRWCLARLPAASMNNGPGLGFRPGAVACPGPPSEP